jgi:hypothetical protein
MRKEKRHKKLSRSEKNYRSYVLYLFRFNLKKCTKCKEIKPLSEFGKSSNKTYIIPYKPWCNICNAKYMRDRYKLKALGLWKK